MTLYPSVLSSGFESSLLLITQYSIKFILRYCVFLCFLPSFAFANDCRQYAVNGLPSNTGTLLCRKGYLLAHDTVRKTPYWVAEHLTLAKATGTITRKDSFKPDPELKRGERAELSDYRKSGYDRGHMAPSADMSWDEVAMKESFYLSNMVPQVGKGMNQGIWKDLEEKVRRWAICRGELYIYTGPVYVSTPENMRTIGKNKVAIPTHLYKIIYDPTKHEAISFLMPNTKLKTSDLPNYIISIDTIEQESGLDFFPEMEDQREDPLEFSKAVAMWID